jgi:hypothetical protein
LIAGQALARLFALVGLYTNFFQPSFKLLARERDGSRVAKRYDRPKTPCQRMLEHPTVPVRVKESLQEICSNLDPLSLLGQIRQAQGSPGHPAGSGCGQQGTDRRPAQRLYLLFGFSNLLRSESQIASMTP